MVTELRKYLFLKEQSISSFAKELGMSRAYIDHVVRGDMPPSRLLAEKIEQLTEGQIKAEDLLAHKKEKKLKKLNKEIEKLNKEIETLK